MPQAPGEKVIKYDAVFEKKGDMVYISHLDLMTLFRRAIRRSGLPFVITGGFTPRVKISIPKALKLGRESENESANLWLSEIKPVDEIRDAVNREMPEGIRITEVAEKG
ncbi:MAG: TIGR03936 family radical SAM-associated protein [Candidatus Omnitrophota bacterium]